MNVMPFIPKDVEGMPDFWKVKIIYHNGKTEELNVVFQTVDEKQIFIFLTHEDEWKWRPLSAIQGIDFDKNYTKIKELEKNKFLEKKNENKS